MTAALKFEIGCPECGGAVTPVAVGRPDTKSTTAIVQCAECRVEAQVVVYLTVIHDPKYRAPNGCGKVQRKTRAAA